MENLIDDLDPSSSENESTNGESNDKFVEN